MGSARTKRKNLQKRRKRRLFATLTSEIRASEEAQWTPQRQELELMRNEERRQRVHEQWEKAVAESAAKFNKKRRIQAQRQQLILALRQKMQEGEAK